MSKSINSTFTKGAAASRCGEASQWDGVRWQWRHWWHLAAVLDDVPCTSGGVGIVRDQVFCSSSAFRNEVVSFP